MRSLSEIDTLSKRASKGMGFFMGSLRRNWKIYKTDGNVWTTRFKKS